jgi:hypothetical protein
LQFDGKETVDDKVEWDNPERRLPYGDNRSLDKKSDCSSFWQNIYDVFLGINIGTWTEGIWSKYRTKRIKWEDRRPGDLIFWNFKKGRTVSHVAGYIGNGRILHTTSPGNPLRVEKDTYSKSHRVGVIRILTDAQYNSLLFVDDPSSGGGQPPTPKPPAYLKYPTLKYKKYNDGFVKIMQKALKKKGYDLGNSGEHKDGVDGDFGKVTLKAFNKFQKANGIKQSEVCDKDDWAKLLG